MGEVEVGSMGGWSKMKWKFCIPARLEKKDVSLLCRVHFEGLVRCEIYRPAALELEIAREAEFLGREAIFT